MSLPSGKRLGPYEIVSRIGAGGMGEVFRARDTRLDRTVAVKTLPAALATNAQLSLRLQREAKAISALSHPNICALYDVGEQDGVHFLVMEHLEGETLADRLERGPLPLREALRYGIEIANALERAHRERVVHRDLKPGNVMLTKSGTKLLDFGLAKSITEDPISADAPTMHAPSKQPLTAEGTIVGTFQYMAPEQLEAAAVDARTDIFAFGAVLYEMITGRRAFAGKTRTSLIAAIVAANPRPMSELQPVTPHALEHVVARCLEKDPDERWQSAHDVRLELEYILRQLDAPAGQPKRNVLPWAIAAAAALAALAAGYFAIRNERATPSQAVRAHILPPRGDQFNGLIDSLSISPDARYITFRPASDARLWLRPLGGGEAKAIEGTETAVLPLWSPDSRWIAFSADNKLKKVSVGGGPPVTICDASKARPGAWSRDGVILFSATSVTPLSRVSADGGTPQPLTKLTDGETTHRWATFLPDGDRFLYLAASHSEGGDVDGAVYASSLAEPEKRTLVVRTRSNVAFVRGHLLYVRGRHLLAQPFDAGALKLTGEPVTVATGIDSHLGYFRSAFATADDGTLVFQPGRDPEEVTLMRSAPPAAPVEIMRPQLNITSLRLSPDRRKTIARVTHPATGLHDLWIIDLEQKTKQRVTSTAKESEWDGEWSPDGKKIAFVRTHGFAVKTELVVKTLDNSEPDRVVLREAAKGIVLHDWSGDGRHLVYHAMDPGNDRSGDLFVVPVADGVKPVPVAATPAHECCGSFSPDGKWLVYMSTESGAAEAYATRFPPAGPPVSLGSRNYMRWSPTGEMYVVANDIINLAPVTISGNVVTVGPHRPGPAMPEGIVNGETDGKQWIYVAAKQDPHYDSLTLLTGWLPKSP